MADLLSTEVAANYAKTAHPYSNFGTRDLAFYLIDIANIETSVDATNSVFTKVIRGVQSVGELYYVGEPTANGVIVAVAQQTLTNSTDDNSQTLAEAVDAATGGTSTVTLKTIVGAAFV
jgi:hypothetical protein